MPAAIRHVYIICEIRQMKTFDDPISTLIIFKRSQKTVSGKNSSFWVFFWVDVRFITICVAVIPGHHTTKLLTYYLTISNTFLSTFEFILFCIHGFKHHYATFIAPNSCNGNKNIFKYIIFLYLKYLQKKIRKKVHFHGSDH